MGQIYNLTTKESDFINDHELIPDGWTDKKPLWRLGEYWNGTEWIVDEVAETQKLAIKNISVLSRQSRASILDDQTIMNILAGAIDGYPEYLTAANVALMIEQFKTISRNAKAAVSAATTLDEIESIMNSLAFPTEAEIISQIAEE